MNTSLTTTTFALLTLAAVAATGCALAADDELDLGSVELRTGSAVYDAVADFGADNPNGVWSYGYGTVGGDFTLAPDFTTGNIEYRGGGVTANAWRGFHHNATAQAQPRHTGLTLQPHAVTMHPGNSVNHLAKLRFTAPAGGCYDVDVTWTAADQQAKKTWVWVYTNAETESGAVYPFTPAGFKESFSQGLEGYGDSASYIHSFNLQEGEILSFEVGNGGDGYYDDSLDLALTIAEVACAAEVVVEATCQPGSIVSQWMDTGLTVAAGEPLTITASGSASAISDPTSAHGPDGYGAAAQHSDFLVPGLTIGALVGKIDNGAPFEVGSVFALPSPIAGTLYLGFNDSLCGDNFGEYTVHADQ